MAARDHGNIHRAAELRASTMVELLERCDALRKPDRFAELLQACEADHRGRLGLADRPYPQAAIWQAALVAARAVDAGALAAQQSAEPRDSLAQRIRDQVRAARISAVAQALGRPAR
jgi:tRNA nucleotidyltransferase (CCA-adding enzyme)